jgi:CBS domain containing-hemolysin-like protein
VSGADWGLLAAVVVLFALSAVLALSETAFTKMSRIRAIQLEEEGRRGAGRLTRMLEEPARTLNAVLLAVLICQFTAATLVGVLVEQLGALAVLVGTVVEVVLFFVVAEVAPKTYAIQHTDRAALRVTPMLWFLTNFWPVRMLSRGLIGAANVLLPGKGLKEGPFVTEQEIRTMADVAAEEDVIEREERALIHSIFEFGDTVVREVMRPRPDMVTVVADDTIESAIAVAIDRGYSRIPACGESTDDVVGLVYLKDLVRRARAGEGNEPVRNAVRPATFVPEQKRVAELLREMQNQQFHMALVIDEYGDTVGLVTLEDLLEEIVGEIADEYDVEEPRVEHLPDGSLRFPGGAPIDEVSEELGTELPDTEWDTIGGFVLNLLGHVPEEGETVAFPGFELRAEQVRERRIGAVVVRPIATGADAGDKSTTQSTTATPTTAPPATAPPANAPPANRTAPRPGTGTGEGHAPVADAPVQ